MDRTRQSEQRLLAHAVRAMEPLGLRFSVLRQGARPVGHSPDAWVGLQFGGRQLRFAAEVKRGLRPATLGAVVQRLRTHAGRRKLLVADHVTPPLADALRGQGVEFIDAAGNAFLNQPPLLVFVKGQRPTGPVATPNHGRAFQATGLQVLFAVLARPELMARPYREIAVAAGVAHGTVGWVMAELPGLGYLAQIGGRRRLINGERLLDQWAEAYARTLRPRLLLGRFRGDMGALLARSVPWPEGLLLGGELAAARLTRHLRPGTATFYAEAIDTKVLLELVLGADAEGNVEFRRRFWNFPGEATRLAPTLLVYADLLAIGDARCLETAQLLRGPLIARLV
ncbi:MAG: type IV toxin-antitoxin system AbiEi family antitoxin [Solirubrobacterales bacterium]